MNPVGLYTLEEIMKIHKLPNTLLGPSFEKSVIDILKWRTWIELNQKVFDGVQNFCPEAAGRVTINSHFNPLRSNWFIEIYPSYAKYRFLVLKNSTFNMNTTSVPMNNYQRISKVCSMSLLTDCRKVGSVLFLDWPVESVCDVSLQKVAQLKRINGNCDLIVVCKMLVLWAQGLLKYLAVTLWK